MCDIQVLPDDAAKRNPSTPFSPCAIVPYADQKHAPALGAFFRNQNRVVHPLRHLCRSLDLGEGLADLVSLLLLEAEELEALEVGQGFSALCPQAALGPLALEPLLVDLGLLPELLQCAGAEGAGDFELDVGEEDIGKGNSSLGYGELLLGAGSINQNLDGNCHVNHRSLPSCIFLFLFL